MSDKTKRVEESKKIEDNFPLTLDEFCARLSSTDGRVELIGGFHASELSDGVSKDMTDNFMKRFIAFTNKPVK